MAKKKCEKEKDIRSDEKRYRCKKCNRGADKKSKLCKPEKVNEKSAK